MRVTEIITELRRNSERNPKLPISVQIKKIIEKNGGTIDDYWIHCSPVDHIGFYGNKNNPPMNAVFVPSRAFSGQISLKYTAVERGYDGDRSRHKSGKPGLWLSPLEQNLDELDFGSVPFLNNFIFLVKINDDAWLQPIDSKSNRRATWLGLHPPSGKRKIGQYNKESEIAVVFEPAFKVVGKWTKEELKNQAERNKRKQEFQQIN